MVPTMYGANACILEYTLLFRFSNYLLLSRDVARRYFRFLSGSLLPRTNSFHPWGYAERTGCVAECTPFKGSIAHVYCWCCKISLTIRGF